VIATAAKPRDRGGKNDTRSDEVAVLAPSGRDSTLADRVLSKWGVRAVPYATVETLAEAIRRGVGVVVIAEEALGPTALDRLLAALGDQPAWSDLPIVLLTVEGELSRAFTASVETLASRGNVMFLERPVRVATLVTVLRTRSARASDSTTCATTWPSCRRRAPRPSRRTGRRASSWR
jgi:FixJ family two-component response regulator